MAPCTALTQAMPLLLSDVLQRDELPVKNTFIQFEVEPSSPVVGRTQSSPVKSSSNLFAQPPDANDEASSLIAPASCKSAYVAPFETNEGDASSLISSAAYEFELPVKNTFIQFEENALSPSVGRTCSCPVSNWLTQAQLLSLPMEAKGEEESQLRLPISRWTVGGQSPASSTLGSSSELSSPTSAALCCATPTAYFDLAAASGEASCPIMHTVVAGAPWSAAPFAPHGMMWVFVPSALPSPDFSAIPVSAAFASRHRRSAPVVEGSKAPKAVFVDLSKVRPVAAHTTMSS